MALKYTFDGNRVLLKKLYTCKPISLPTPTYVQFIRL